MSEETTAEKRRRKKAERLALLRALLGNAPPQNAPTSIEMKRAFLDAETKT
jgi:hypothetical protein